MNLIPENNLERILHGENVTPNNRTEYFVKQAIDNAGSGGGSITVDDALDDTSENPVQNKVIAAALEAINNDYRVDIEPVIDEQTQQLVIKANKSIADIYAAAVALKHVWAHITVPGVATTYQRMEITQYAYVANTYQVVFGAVQEDEVAVKHVVLVGSNTNAGDPADDSWNYAE